jgi:hypothetical protein
MTRRRGWAARCTPTVLALFLGTSALPRASVYAHHHAGGELEHEHPWGSDLPHDHEHEGHHHEGRVHQPPPHGEVWLVDADDDPPDHVHWQPPFQRAATPGVPRAATAVVVAALAIPPRTRAGFRATVSTPARAPPSPLAR